MVLNEKVAHAFPIDRSEDINKKKRICDSSRLGLVTEDLLVAFQRKRDDYEHFDCSLTTGSVSPESGSLGSATGSPVDKVGKPKVLVPTDEY